MTLLPYKILSEFYQKPQTLKNTSETSYLSFLLKWGRKYGAYHSFPQHIQEIIMFVGKETKMLEVGSGVGIIAALLAFEGNIKMTCTDTEPPNIVYHECYMIDDPFTENKLVNKKCIDGCIIQEYYQKPYFDSIIFVWPPLDLHCNNNVWYKPENILKKALEINKDVKVIVIGEEAYISDDGEFSESATGTKEFWRILKEKFKIEKSLENENSDIEIYERTMMFVPK